MLVSVFGVRDPTKCGEVRRAEYIPCRKSTPVEAEHAAELWARGLMDAMARLARVSQFAKARSASKYPSWSTDGPR
jgi:hypothetical protein